jgi:predicted enzyme related to lactoylglutathione lyase
MGIGTLRCHVIDVNDLDQAEAFWSELTGLPVIGSKWTGRFSYLGQAEPWKHEIILQLVDSPKGSAANRSHVDIEVADIDLAIARVEAIGGRVKKEPSIYPRPGSFEGEPPLLDWAVMQDPFGNEFCMVSVLTPEERTAVLNAATTALHQTDREWRVAAGRHKAQPAGS